MYIEYIRNQREIRDSYGIAAREAGINCPLEDTEVPEFKPTWLVRVSDMQVVPGSSVNEHYWAFSYSWNQSGELIHKGGEEYDRIDEGRHQITEYHDRNIHADTDGHTKTTSTVGVHFEGLVQQICKDFSVRYIWFDQICINQGDHDAKMQEIKQMHNIYKNARCTIALIPEFRWIPRGKSMGPDLDAIPSSQWCKRIWTLEEAYVSKNIVFLGKDVHIWGNIDLMWNITARVIKIPKHKHRKWAASTALWFARKRTSSKAHDRIFALANIFPEIMDGISFNYKQPLIDLMLQFYGALAQKDTSILLFGAADDSDLEDKIKAVRQKEASLLPSWTGAYGAHISQFALRSELTEVTPDYKIAEGSMYLASSFVTARLEAPSAVEKPDGFDNPELHHRTLRIDFGGTSKPFIARAQMPTEDALQGTAFCFESEIPLRTNGLTYLTFVATTSKSQRLYNRSARKLGLKVTHVLPLTVEEKVPINTLVTPTHYGGFLSLTEECSECIILLEPAFSDGLAHDIYPVIKRSKICYKSIGICVLDIYLNIDSFARPEHNFCIK